MSKPEHMGDFHGATVDYAVEYVAARKLMGTKGTDLTKLEENVAFMLLNCPNKLSTHFQALLEEIGQRQVMLLFKGKS